MTDKQFSPPIHKTVTVVGFGRRLLAMVIDGAMVGFITFIVMAGIGFVGVLAASFNPGDPTVFDTLIILSGLIVSIAYFAVSWTKSGQTLGKNVTGIKVVGADGSLISWGQALLRYVGYIISGAIFSLGFLWVALDPKRQGWHDKIARTYVVDEDTNFSGASNVDFVPSDPGRNWVWLAIWAVLLITMPGVLLTSLLLLGPVISRSFTNFLSNLL